MVIYFSKGKHHEYGDGGWSGQTDRICINIKAHTNGRGHLHQPPFPGARPACAHLSGRGDRFDFTNVGTFAHPFFDDLGPYGFPGQRIWSGKLFYSEEGATGLPHLRLLRLDPLPGSRMKSVGGEGREVRLTSPVRETGPTLVEYQ